MPRFRIPEGDDWRDHAEPCPNCKQPVLSRRDHYHDATMVDPGWYSCDRATCAYCDETENLRQLHDGWGFKAPDYVCAECFTPSDAGPGFDDLPLTKE